MFNVTEDFKVIKTEPSNGRSNVALNSEIKVYFNQAVDETTLHTGTLIVARNSATPIAGSVRYEVTPRGEFVGIFTPQVVLQAETTYQITVVGLTHPFTGSSNSIVKSVVGISLGRNYVFTMSTGAVSVQPPVIELPAESSSIRDERPRFQWTVINGATFYELEIGTSELMDPLYVPPGGTFQYPITVPGDVDNWTPEDLFERGQQYYWRIRTYQNSTYSAWSAIYSFYLMKEHEEAPYIPQPDETFVPTADAVRVFGGAEGFRIISVEPAPNSLDQDPDYFKVHFNKAIDEDHLDNSDQVQILFRGLKIIKSDPNTTEPGDIEIDDYYADPDDPMTLIIVPVGGADPE